MDDKCLFKQHISSICRKAYSTVNVIFRCFHTANIDALIKAYTSFVHPVLEYCLTVWNPYIPAKHYLGMTDQLKNVQRLFTRLVYYRYQLYINHGYIQRLEYLKLRRIYDDMVMIYNTLHGHVNVSENNLISCNNPVINTTISTRSHGFFSFFRVSHA